MKALRYLAIGLGGVVVLTAVAIAVAAMNLDSARVKQELARIMLEKTQRTLRIDGDLSLSFWPSIGVELGRLSLSERNSNRPFVALDSARVAVQVMPLLQQQMVIDRIELVGLKVELLRHKDGTLNIADLLAKNAAESKKENQAEETASSRRVQFEIAGIRLANAQLIWSDESSGQDWALSGFNLTTGRLADAADGKLELLLLGKRGLGCLKHRHIIFAHATYDNHATRGGKKTGRHFERALEVEAVDDTSHSGADREL